MTACSRTSAWAGTGCSALSRMYVNQITVEFMEKSNNYKYLYVQSKYNTLIYNFYISLFSCLELFNTKFDGFKKPPALSINKIAGRGSRSAILLTNIKNIANFK